MGFQFSGLQGFPFLYGSFIWAVKNKKCNRDNFAYEPEADKGSHR